VLLIVFLLGIPAWIPFLSETLADYPLGAILNVGTFFMQGAAFYLIFSGNAVSWFKKPAPVEDA
jgi:hypothetical protein